MSNERKNSPHYPPDRFICASQGVAVKNNHQNANMPWPSNQNEQNLRNFGRISTNAISRT